MDLKEKTILVMMNFNELNLMTWRREEEAFSNFKKHSDENLEKNLRGDENYF